MNLHYNFEPSILLADFYNGSTIPTDPILPSPDLLYSTSIPYIFNKLIPVAVSLDPATIFECAISRSFMEPCIVAPVTSFGDALPTDSVASLRC